MDIETLKLAIKSEFFRESFEDTFTALFVALIEKGVITMNDIKEANAKVTNTTT